MDWKKAIKNRKLKAIKSKQMRQQRKDERIKIEQDGAVKIAGQLGIEKLLLSIRDQVWELGKIIKEVSITSGFEGYEKELGIGVARVGLRAEYLRYAKRSWGEYETFPARIRTEEYYLGVLVTSVRENSTFSVAVVKGLWQKPGPVYIPEHEFSHVVDVVPWVKLYFLNECERLINKSLVPIIPIAKSSHKKVQQMIKKDEDIRDDKQHVKWAIRRMKEIEREF